MPKMQNVHLKCWNDKNHCQVAVVGLKSLDVSPYAMNFNFYLWLLKILWPENTGTSSHISRHLEFIIEQGHRSTGSAGSLDSQVTGSLGHKMWPSSIFDLQETNACAYTAPLQLDIEEMQRERRPNGQRWKQENGKTKKVEAKDERYSRDAQRMKDRKLKGRGWLSWNN